MINRNIKLLIAASFTLIAAISFTACQQNSQTPERPINIKDRPPIVKDTTPPQAIYPTLSLSAQNAVDPNIPAVNTEFQLKSQTSRYTTASKSALEINLTNSKSASCETENPELKEGESIIQITIQSKDGKPLSKGNYSADKYTLAGSITTMTNGSKQQQKFTSDQFKTFLVTDLNNAIFRGSLEIKGSSTSLSGEFFTAICKQPTN